LGSGAPPARDADGKFPCPYCAKSFARTWHLTRHLRSRKCRSEPLACPRESSPALTSLQRQVTAHTCARSAATPSRAAMS
jgi:uncharacterized Zn-finger protein